jgi:hypothetical protein
MAQSRLLRYLGRLVATIAIVYVLFLAGLFAAMCQRPERFGQIMARVPMITMIAVPFEPMWNIARGGGLQVGDTAPDFTLSTVDRKSRVTLSSYRGKQPVALIFGSYT